MLKSYRIKHEAYCLLFIFIILAGCKKFVEVDTPSTKTSTESAYKDNSTAAAVLTGLYATMSNGYFYSLNLPATSLFQELSADNLMMIDVNINEQFRSFYLNSIEPKYNTSFNSTYWKNVYSMMYNINASITGLTNNTYLSPQVAKRLLGEAYFLRAFCYFYMVNIYGDVPLILTNKYEVNSVIGRSPTTDVYKQIELDLAEAEQLLDFTYAASDVSRSTTERLRPNLAAVNALQARVYLYEAKYALAEEKATKVINQSSIYELVDLISVFLKNSKETIWALQPVNNNYNTAEGGLFTLPLDGPNSDHPLLISHSLMQSFESGDNRKENWIGIVSVGPDNFPYPNKYKVPFIDGSKNFTEYTIVLRLAEQYLIRAEARNEQGNITGAIDDLNALRTRSRADATDSIPDPLPNLQTTLTQVQLRPVILNERRIELFTEWGHRWFDLKRTGNIDAKMIEAETYKGGQWEPYKALFPIPVSDILLNPAIKQNLGYTN